MATASSPRRRPRCHRQRAAEQVGDDCDPRQEKDESPSPERVEEVAGGQHEQAPGAPAPGQPPTGREHDHEEDHEPERWEEQAIPLE